MSQIITFKPLGEILKDAGLISAPQVEVALRDRQCYEDMRFGEILALRGWVGQETADFFAEEWLNIVNQKRKHPLGFYLKKASLLNDAQIETILEEQKKNFLRFGTTAVIKGFLKQNTVDFFLENLFPNQAMASPFRNDPQQAPQSDDYVSEEDITHWVILSAENLTIH